MNAMLRIGFLVASLLAAAHAQAQIYKCVDSSGKTVYLQSPCPTGASSRVIGSKPSPAPETPASKSGTPADKSASAKAAPLTPEEAFQKRQKERAEAEKKASDQAAELKRRQDDCQRAREQVAQYDMGGRISRMDAKGERYFLDDDQIAREKAKAQASAAELCR
jgi:hypothetical protein